MEPVLAVVVGALFAAGVYLILRRDLFRTVLGLIVLSSAANLLTFVLGRLVREHPPLLPDPDTPTATLANPLPQALVLTAIVISFGFTLFTLVLVYRSFHATGTLDPDATPAALPPAGSDQPGDAA